MQVNGYSKNDMTTSDRYSEESAQLIGESLENVFKNCITFNHR